MRFEIRHEVIVARPLDEVFAVLALPENIERVIRLSPMATRFELLGTRPGPTSAIPIASFEFGERVRLLGGLYVTEFGMRGEQTVDGDARRVDYRTRSTGGAGIQVHKIRTFGAVAAGTRVVEVVTGNAAPGLHWIARRSARAAHVDHMSRYSELFEPRP